MNVTRRVALALGLSAMALPALAENPIRIGIDASYAPFGYVDEAGTMAGFDVDISNALCTAMQAQCEIVNLPWDGIFAALEAGNIDAVITSVNITAERKEKYEIVGPYYQSPMAWMAAPGAGIDGTLATLEGKTVGTLTGPSLEEALRAQFGDKVNLSIYDSMDAAALDLSAGRVDAVYGDQLQLLHGYVTRDTAAYALVGEPVPFGEGKGIILRKGETDLAARMTEALAAIVASGEHGKISTTYFGQPLTITH